MTRSHKFLLFAFSVFFFTIMAVAPAAAADIFGTIKGRAATFLVQLKPVIFILAGFGLIGFAWMAIFGQISWKWFANIAMGLFLVANMGIFIDYFAKKDNSSRKYGDLLGRADYSDHLGADYQGTAGTAGDPAEQSAASGDGTGGASSSDQLESELDKKIQAASSEEECKSAGGQWADGSCSRKSSAGGSEGTSYADAGNNNLGDQTKRDICIAQGGNWNGSTCVQGGENSGGNNSSGNNPQDSGAPAIDAMKALEIECASKGGTWNPSIKLCVNNNATDADCKKLGFVSDGKGGCTVPPTQSPANDRGGSDNGKSQNSEEQQAPQNGQTSSQPSKEQMSGLAESLKKQYSQSGRINLSQLLRDEVAAGRMTAEQASQAGYLFTQISEKNGGDINKTINEVLKNYK